MNSDKTEQEIFWQGNFGDDYAERNKGDVFLAGKTVAFSMMLSRVSGISSAIEFGSNTGSNLIALKRIMPDLKVSAIEINQKATSILKHEYAELFGSEVLVYQQSILEWDVDFQRDLAFTSGVLIHIGPSSLQCVYQKLYDASSKYILIAEYFNTTPVEVLYRGNSGKLFKRDFCGEMLDKFSDLKLRDYGFFYQRDTAHHKVMDDITWFLLEK